MADHGFAAFAKAKFATLPDLSSQPCIYKAPAHLREVNKECYRPYVVSIGPLYYKHPSLEDHDMQDCKMRCLKFFLEHDSNSYKSDLEHYLTILRELEGRVRDCYSVSISLSSDEFNGMLLADSAFIICLFIRRHPNLSSSSFLFDILKRNITYLSSASRDLFLEENQIPWFVLDRLFREAFGDISFIDLACTFISSCGIPVVNQHVNAATATEIAHLVDLLRNFCITPTLQDQAGLEPISTMNVCFTHLVRYPFNISHLRAVGARFVASMMNVCFTPTLQDHQVALEPSSTINVKFPSNISQLRDAGVKFVPSKSANMFDITFSKGVLKIPPFNLEDGSESYYRSMILFEQSHLPLLKKSYFVDYLTLLNSLIKTPEDVQILVQSGIIDNGIGSEETISRLFNGITTHIIVSENFYYFGVCEDLNKYANKRWNKWKAILKKDYFSHPWAAISVIYAILLFILTLLQTLGTFTNN